jgi:hypothetical protein
LGKIGNAATRDMSDVESESRFLLQDEMDNTAGKIAEVWARVNHG